VTQVHRLLSIATVASGDGAPRRDLLPPGPRGDELHRLLVERDGFYAFESALHLRAGSLAGGEGLAAWNSPDGWRGAYRELVDGDVFFFAEDAFSHQFAVHRDGIVGFNPETAEITPFAGDIEEWAARTLDDYRVVTGHPVMHDWQTRHGAIPRGRRLLPRIPFVLGGSFEVANMVLVGDEAAMRYWASFAHSTHGLANGERVVFDEAELTRLLDGDAPRPPGAL
jgi:hypothetical protein